MAARSACVLGDGWQLTVPTRDPVRARHLTTLPSLTLVAADVHDPAELDALCAGRTAVINLVGILNERGRDGSGFERAHAGLAHKLVEACRRQHVDRLVQVSALNADAEGGPSHYLRSKGRAERIIREQSGPDLRWTILRPSVIFGPGDGFVNRFAGLLRAIPLAFPLARPAARFAPGWVGDFVAAIQRSLSDEATAGEIYELCGPEQLALREAVVMIRDRLQLRRAVIGLPDFAARLQAALFDFVPGKPFSTDNYRSLGIDSVCRVNGLARLGLKPQPLSALLPKLLS
jgi:NADH dehydrogenase